MFQRRGENDQEEAYGQDLQRNSISRLYRRCEHEMTNEGERNDRFETCGGHGSLESSTRYVEVDGGGWLGIHADGIQCLFLRSS